MTPSLFDTAGHHALDVYLVFSNRQNASARWWRLLKDGFRHVEMWKYNGLFWMRVEPCFEFTEVSAHFNPPWIATDPGLKPTVLRVNRLIPHGKLSVPFTFGPVTCVELVKAFIGMNSFFTRTPYQLYRKLKHDG